MTKKNNKKAYKKTVIFNADHIEFDVKAPRDKVENLARKIASSKSAVVIVISRNRGNRQRDE